MSRRPIRKIRSSGGAPGGVVPPRPANRKGNHWYPYRPYCPPYYWHRWDHDYDYDYYDGDYDYYDGDYDYYDGDYDYSDNYINQVYRSGLRDGRQQAIKSMVGADPSNWPPGTYPAPSPTPPESSPMPPSNGYNGSKAGA